MLADQIIFESRTVHHEGTKDSKPGYISFVFFVSLCETWWLMQARLYQG